MRIVLDKTYMKYSLYTILTVTILYILYMILSNLGLILETTFHALGVAISVLTPLIIALVIAYFLHPLVSWIDAALLQRIKPLADPGKNGRRQHLRRTLSVLITYLFFMLVLVLIIYILYLMISGSLPRNMNLNDMIATIGTYIQSYNELFNQIIARLQAAGMSDNLKNQLMDLIQVIQDFIGKSMTGLFSSLGQIGNSLVKIILGVVIAFYLLKDLEYFSNLYHQGTELLFNRSHNEKLSDFLSDVNEVIGNFIRGQLLVALLVGITSSIGLYLAGLDYAVLVGMTAGLFNIIPYFGPTIGAVIAVIVALVSGSPITAVYAVLALIVVQQLDGNLFTPKIIGDSVGIHPVFIILSIVIGGHFFGLVGMLLAVPVAGIINLVLVNYVDLSRFENK